MSGYWYITLWAVVAAVRGETLIPASSLGTFPLYDC